MFVIVFVPIHLKRKENAMSDAAFLDEKMESEIMSRDLHIHIIEKLHYRFHVNFIEGQGYLDPNLTITSVAKQLDTNRTYLSEVVNEKYGMPFRELVNQLRIDYAKKLLLDEPKMTVVAVARSSGFLGSNQFVRKFRELEGNTPAVWRNSKLSPTANSAEVNPDETNPADVNPTDSNPAEIDTVDINPPDSDSLT
jgi:AraC-like DNA-binding protein